LDTLQEYAFPVVIITIVTIFGKTIATGMGALVSGQPLKQSVQAGMSLAQIGEFSFIIATLGMTLGVTSGFLYPIVVAVSAIPNFIQPVFIKNSLKAYHQLKIILPKKWEDRLDNYSSETQTIYKTNHWKKYITGVISHIVIHSVIIAGIVFVSISYLIPLSNGAFTYYLYIFLTVVAFLPFLYALALQRVAATSLNKLKSENKNITPLILIALFRILLCIVIVFIMINELINPLTGVIVLAILISFAVLFPKKIQNMYGKIQHQFIENFNDRERSEAIRNKSDLTPWDGHMTTFEIPQESLIAGKTLNELKVREELGVNIAIIKRGDLVINIPDKDEKIFPKDILYVIGTDDQVRDFELFVDKSLVGSVDYHTEIVL